MGAKKPARSGLLYTYTCAYARTRAHVLLHYRGHGLDQRAGVRGLKHDFEQVDILLERNVFARAERAREIARCSYHRGKLKPLPSYLLLAPGAPGRGVKFGKSIFLVVAERGPDCVLERVVVQTKRFSRASR